jgi:hypothetical protein
MYCASCCLASAFALFLRSNDMVLLQRWTICRAVGVLRGLWAVAPTLAYVSAPCVVV